MDGQGQGKAIIEDTQKTKEGWQKGLSRQNRLGSLSPLIEWNLKPEEFEWPCSKELSELGSQYKTATGHDPLVPFLILPGAATWLALGELQDKGRDAKRIVVAGKLCCGVRQYPLCVDTVRDILRVKIVAKPSEDTHLCIPITNWPPLILEKWIVIRNWSNLWRIKDGQGELNINELYAEQYIMHFGETAHSLKFLCDGGNLLFGELNMKGESQGFKQALQVYSSYKESLKWKDCISALGFGRAVKDSDVLLGCEYTENGNRLPILINASGAVKIKHTDLHLSCVPATMNAFCNQLLVEMAFPMRIRRSQGYNEVQQEVAGLLKSAKLSFCKEQKALDPTAELYARDDPYFDIIVWERQVDTAKTDQDVISSSSTNREIMDGEWLGSVSGAIESLSAVEGVKPEALTVLRLGDKNQRFEKKYPELFDLHRKKGNGRRAMLQQLQFLSAVMEVSGARLIVAQRTGLSDLICKVSGVPMCQFNINLAHGSDDKAQRLRAVWTSGAGMGYVVNPWSGQGSEILGTGEEIYQKTVHHYVAKGCMESMRARKQLELECEKFAVGRVITKSKEASQDFGEQCSALTALYTEILKIDAKIDTALLDDDLKTTTEIRSMQKGKIASALELLMGLGKILQKGGLENEKDVVLLGYVNEAIAILQMRWKWARPILEDS